MKRIISLTALSAVLLSSPAFAADGQTLHIKKFIGTVIITTGNSFSVSGKKGNISETLKHGLIINGNHEIDKSKCKSSGGNIRIKTKKKNVFKQFGGYEDLKDYPSLKITVPPATNLKISDSLVFGTGEDFATVDAEMTGCGSLEIGDVSGPVKLNMYGSSDFAADKIGPANIRISGSSHATLNNMDTSVIFTSGSSVLEADSVFGNINITSTGSSTAKMDTVTGALIYKGQGSSSFSLDDIGNGASVTLSGSSTAEMESLTGALVYEGQGSSSFSLEDIKGKASVTLSSSSSCEIEDGIIPTLLIKSFSSSSFEFGGTAGDVTVDSSSSSAVDIDNATGKREVNVLSSASVKIGKTRYSN